MAHNFNDINGLLLFGLERHEGVHIFPPMPMVFLKLNLLHPFTMGGNQKPTVLLNGVPSVVHKHEPEHLWPHIGIVPDPLDAMTPLQILFGAQKCWLPRGSVTICGETSTCCVLGGPMSVNADCWDIGKWPSSLVLDPGTVQTTPSVGDFLAGGLTLAIDAVIDLVFQKIMHGVMGAIGGKLRSFLAKEGEEALEKTAKKAESAVEEGLEAAAKKGEGAAENAAKGSAENAAEGEASALTSKQQCQGGHPVDLTSGNVVDEKVDLSLPGAIPVLWRRLYSSARALQRASLGRGGWVHSFEQWVEQTERGLIVLRDEEGRDVYFRSLQPGESAFHRMDRLTLTALEGASFLVYSHKTRLTRHFEPTAPGGRSRLRAIRDAHGNAVALEYAGERLRCVIDTAGREIRVKQTHGGRIARLEVWAGDSLEQWVDYTYAPMGELASATDALGHAERYAYDEDHRMVKVTLKNGVSFHYAYDPETGRCTKTWGDEGLHTLLLAYDLEKRITRVSGNEEPRVLHWNEDGLVLREETPDGILLRTCAYDRDQYLVAEAKGAGESTRYTYDQRGNKVREVDPADNVTEWEHEEDLPVLRVGPDGLITKYAYDELGSLVEVIYPSQVHYALSYDLQGHVQEVRGEEGLLAAFKVDARHNVVEEVDARGAKMTYTFDRLGRPLVRTDALNRRAEVVYDRLGQPISIQRPDGTSRTSVYDALGNPVQVTDALGQMTAMEYAGTGTLTKLVQPDGRIWRFKYTAQEKLRTIENPRGEAYAFAYDTAGRVTEETTFDDRVLRYRYAEGGRLARIDYPDQSFRAFSHDPLGNVLREESSDGPITFQRDRMGRLLGAVVEQDGQQVVTLFERDRLGRVVADVQDGQRVGYEHDARGRRTARVMPDGATTRYRYDTLGELTGLAHDGYELQFERDVLGRERARRDASGKVAIRSEYDSMDRIIEQRVDVEVPGAGVPAAVVQRFWQYDALGRVKLVEDGRWGATRYWHDAMGQLLEAQRGAHREVFAYDAAGSLQKMIEGLEASPAQAAEAEPWEIGKGNLLLRTERARYAYDRRGRRVLKLEGGEGSEGKRTEYDWDCQDRLREVRLPSGERVAFRYDAFGRRMRKEVHDEDGRARRAVNFVWDGDVLAADTDGRHGRRCFVHAPGSFVPLLQAEQGEVFAYVTDHVGVPKELVDQRGKVTWSAAHSAWGWVREKYVDPERTSQPEPEIKSPFQLIGQYADEETGLCYTRFRYFDVEMGIWCSPDPLGISGGFDAYHIEGSPVHNCDPLGLIDIFRGMTASEDGKPVIGNSKRTLGPALDDIPVDENGMVHPETGGISASPNDPMNLPKHRKPPEFGGTGKDPVFRVNTDELPEGLKYRPDPKSPSSHGFIEPSRKMKLEEYQDLISQSREHWSKVCPN